MDPEPYPGPWQLLRIWSNIGFQSFGGGSSTQYLIQREFTETHTWLTQEELLHYLALCTLTPGINLIALTILIGRKLAGWRGIAASLAGMLLPSTAVTCLLAALATQVATQPGVQAALRGVVPATAGAMLFVGLNFARPLARSALRDRGRALVVSLLLVAASVATIVVARLPVAIIVIAALALGGLLFPVQPPPAPGDGQGQAR
ncbi:MAG: chromate transporter [Thermomicrobiales bacterium]